MWVELGEDESIYGCDRSGEKQRETSRFTLFSKFSDSRMDVSENGSPCTAGKFWVRMPNAQQENSG